MPSNVSAAALSIAAAAGGALKSCITTPLLTFEEGLEAMKKAMKAGYQPQNSTRKSLERPLCPRPRQGQRLEAEAEATTG